MVSKLKLGLYGLGLILIAIGVATAVGGYLEWRREVAEARQKLQQPVAEISTTATALLSFETKARKGSYEAILGRGEAQIKHLAETGKQVAAATLPHAEKAALTAYLGELTKLTTAEVSKYRKLKATATALDGAKSLAVDLSNPALASRATTRERFRQLLSDADKGLDAMDAADGAFYKQVITSRDELERERPALTGYPMIDDKVILDVIAAHQTTAK
ncbi:ElaB/YqjD/DUF883 family membrane-anchored ribosome-binding protein [Rhizomicrobium palustre]|uniref:ElaB/YqjD/DUF883 family membrane-anchored ribosome-binding protein n=1 Tax=Rhizomicrobium palustre TaxID=189966 RepID=A0A846MZH2_9PROT|nr:hypothetical protein [Rhizomicrobium palustre]NIK88713.1 ElaB/YqjD/DUF883 family membrane-anchored ribosome-binding protein [Rhizomicrobium palustre]